MTNNATYIKLILATFFWGGTLIAGKTAAGEIGGIATAFYRFGLSSILFLFLIAAQHKKWSKIQITDYFKIFILGASGIYGYSLFFYDGLQHITAGQAGLIVAFNPIVTMLVASFFLGEKLNRNMLIGIGLSLVGAIIIFYMKYIEFEQQNLGNFKGELMMFGCVISWVTFTVVGKGLIKKYNPLQITIYACFAGTLLLFIHFMFTELDSLVVPSPRSMFDILYLALLATVLGFLWYYDGIDNIGATRTSQFINLVPVTAIIFGYILLGETIGMVQLAGGALVIIGIFIANKKQAHKNSELA